MKRYHEEKHIIENRAKKYRHINSAWLGYSVPNTGDGPVHNPEPGRYRKTLRCGGCGRSRCQVCHSDKYPKRIPTKQELQSKKDLYDNV